MNKDPKSRRVEGCGAGTGAARVPECGGGRPRPSGVVAVDEAAELLGHGVYQLLLVPLVLPKLGENVVLPARVSHPAQSRNSRVTARAAPRQAPRAKRRGSSPLGGVTHGG